MPDPRKPDTLLASLKLISDTGAKVALHLAAARADAALKKDPGDPGNNPLDHDPTLAVSISVKELAIYG